MEPLHLLIGLTALILYFGLLSVENLIELTTFLRFSLVFGYSGLNLIDKTEQSSGLNFLMVEFGFKIRFVLFG